MSKRHEASLEEWFRTPLGQYVLQWERTHFESALIDVFGYHALQIGLSDLDTLATSRMPHRWQAAAVPQPTENAQRYLDRAAGRVALALDSRALPFAECSLDLVVLPHTLELSANPHASLREVQRVLVHEGKVAIAGLNPTSLWSLRRWRWLGGGRPCLPQSGEFIGHRRLRDWLRLLEFDLEYVSYSCYCPAVRSEAALVRFKWLDRLGPQWWRIFGAAYFMVAVKRTHGAKLVSAAWKKPAVVAGAAAPLVNRSTHTVVSEKVEIDPS